MKKYMIVLLLALSSPVLALEAYTGFYGGSSTNPVNVNGDTSDWANFGGIMGLSTTGDGFYAAIDMTLNDESPVMAISMGLREGDVIATMGIGYGEEQISHNTGFSAPFDSYIKKHDSYPIYFMDIEKSGFFARYSWYMTRYIDTQRRIVGYNGNQPIYGVESFYSKTNRTAIQIGYRLRFH